MDNSFTFYSFLAVVVCVVTGTFFSWLLYRKSNFPGKLKITLAALRALILSMILWLIFSPLIRQVSYTLEKPVIVIAQDNSQSVGAVEPAGFDSSRYRKDLLSLQEELSSRYTVVSYSFGEKLRKGLDFGYKGKFSNASALMRQLNDELLNRNIGAIILATDGIFNRGGNPVEEIAKMKAPLYAIALGDTVPRRDVLIQNADHNDIVYLDNRFNIEVQLHADQCAGEQTRLKVTENGKVLYQQVVNIGKNTFSKRVTVPLKASKTGMHQYTLSLSPVKAELSLENNSQQVSVEVIDDRKKILIAAAAPHPDLSALREAIALDKHHDVSLITGEKLSSVDPSRYGLIILYQLPDLTVDTRVFTDKVKSAKTPLWYITGLQTNINLFNQLQQGISLSPGNGSIRYHYSEVNPALSVFDLDKQAEKAVESFDPLQLNIGQVTISGGHQDILYQRNDKVKTTLPQLFFMNAGTRKTGYLIGEGLWKWKLSEARDGGTTVVFNDLIGKVVQYLAVQNDQRKFIVRPARQSFEENEHILINATLYNDSYAAVNSPDVQLKLKDAKGRLYNYSFSRSGSAYQLDAGILPAGSYSFSGITMFGGRRYTAEGSFFINAVVAEFQQTVADHQLLYQLSAQTNGKMFAPADLGSIGKVLAENENIKTISYEDRRYEEVINFRFLFILVLMMLSTEWFLRKRNGGV